MSNMHNLQTSDIRELARDIHYTAKVNGWYDRKETEDQFVERMCNNLHDEVSELHEAWRNNKLHVRCDKAPKMRKMGYVPLTCLEEELADIIIRVLDNAEHLGVNIQYAINCKHKYNTTRSYRHGNKRS